MEILYHSLKQNELNLLSEFQKNVWEKVFTLLKKLSKSQLSDDSYLEKGLGIDLFLKNKESDFVLYISLTDNCLYINSKYFDIYMYEETDIENIRLTLNEILLGKYLVRLSFGEKDKLISMKIKFVNKKLQKFDYEKKISLFHHSVIREEEVHGPKFID